MADEEQAARLVKLKALLDSGAITQEEFERAKKSILAETPVSALPPITSVKTRKLRLFGVLGLLSLGIPWAIIFWSVGSLEGREIYWHLFSLSWFNSGGPMFYHRFTYVGDVISLLILFLALIGFLSVLAGSILLLQRKRFGGILLLVSVGAWVIGYAIDFIINNISNVVIFEIPIGALLCGIVGVVSLIYKK